MLLTLHTLKSKPFQEQVRTIELLTKQNVDLFERLRPLLEDRSEDSIFHIFHIIRSPQSRAGCSAGRR